MSLTHDTEISLVTEYVHLLTKDQAWYYRVLPKNKIGNLLYL